MKAGIKFARFFCFVSVLSFFICIQAAHSIDLFTDLSLPDLPMAIQIDRVENRSSSLFLKTTREEVYRKWEDGVETSKFDANRFIVGTRINIFRNVFVSGEKLFKGTQNLFNRSSAQGPKIDFKNNESLGQIELSFRGRQNFFSASFGKFGDNLSGFFELEDSAKDAIGGNPLIDLTRKSFERSYRFLHRGEKFFCRLQFSWHDGSEIVVAKPVNMSLNLPLSHSGNKFSGEFGAKTKTRFTPFFRYENIKDSGYGESYRDEKFRFGFSHSEFELKVRAIGVALAGRNPWFVELQQTSFTAGADLKNNLVTLNPLMLFGINEVSNSERLSNRWTNGLRIGGIKKFKSFTLNLQYGVCQFKTEMNSTQLELSNFRKDQKVTPNYEFNEFRLHRLSTQLVRNDSTGKWKLGLILMAPETIKKADDSSITPSGAPSGGTPSQPSTKIDEKARGGWQLTIQREFYL